ncbi:MAG: hypothetical protein ABI882_09465 [Acidobacteriota bacterium]
MRLARAFVICVFLMALAHLAVAQQPASPPAQPKPLVTAPQAPPDSLPAREFARIIREFSEEGGNFFSDNLLSNETAYLHIVDKLKQSTSSGGAYIGVGPEQNFTYIAKVRPRIAFIIDIRHMAAIQQLMYKAIFHLSADRVEFLSRLLSKPPPKGKLAEAGASFNELLAYFAEAPADEELFKVNLTEFSRMIQKDFEYTLATGELQELTYILRSFKDEGLSMTYHWSGGYMPGYFPTLKEVLSETDLTGKQGNFLASADEYRFVREMQLKNLIIPVTGDFAGPRALPAIADFLRKYSLTVSAFYASNVEQYLFDNQVFDDFANNVKKLPVNDQSVFIRSVLSRFGHPAMSPGHQFAILLQRIPVFIKEFDAGRYRQYQTLINSNYIAPGQR